jgi:capsular exopolysaccharide synthesis family protein
VSADLAGGLSPSQVEAYRILRSNLAVSLAELERPTVVVTSARPGEGKTVTSVNLAVSLAQSGRRVVLVDLDLRHPDVHTYLGGHNDKGVTDVLLERRSLEESLQYVEVGEGPGRTPRALYLLATGPSIDNPAELLGSQRTAQLLQALAAQADVVLLDTPPVLFVADTLVIGRMAAGALLVVEARRTPVPVVQQAKDALIRNQTRLLGMVLNKYKGGVTSDGSASFTYGYGAEGSSEPRTKLNGDAGHDVGNS